MGYGDQINKEDSFRSIVDYIDSQFEAWLQEELKIKRNLSAYHDSRVHVCLYFITPNGQKIFDTTIKKYLITIKNTSGHGLKSIDLVCMKKLDSKVNIINALGDLSHVATRLSDALAHLDQFVSETLPEGTPKKSFENKLHVQMSQRNKKRR